MTLLVGILCSDGAVIAADRQTTHGSLGRQTVGQTTVKVTPIKAKVLLASSGHRGLGQQFCHALEPNVDGSARSR
jgi:20S proteasome alpha/beta subunit